MKIDDNDSLGDDRQKQRCSYCSKMIYSTNIEIHQARCGLIKGVKSSELQEKQQKQKSYKKQVQRPDRIEMKKKESIIRQNNSYQQEDWSDKIECLYCGYPQTFIELQIHPNQCQNRSGNCQFCDQIYPLYLMSQHRMQCSSRNMIDLQISDNHYGNLNRFVRGRNTNIFQRNYYDNIYNQANNFFVLLDALIARNGMTSQKGLTREEIQSLKRKKYKQNDVDIEEKDKCTICYCDFQQGQQIVVLKCDHVFHSQCVIKWLQKSVKCPICRRNQTDREQTQDD